MIWNWTRDEPPPARVDLEREAMAWPPATWEAAWDAEVTATPSDRPAGVASFAREVIQTLALAALLSIGLQYIVQQRLVEGSSMEPNLHTGQRLLINRLATWGMGEIRRGDIVVFHSWGDEKDYIKRVVGAPGDTVSIHDTHVYVNGVALDEPYLDQPTTDNVAPTTLGPDDYYVLGDNRGNSADSRYYGPLHRDHIVGTAFLSLWPPEDFGLVEQPSAAQARH
jgi:signal peptidase I